jgi:hypothetical protein
LKEEAVDRTMWWICLGKRLWTCRQTEYWMNEQEKHIIRVYGFRYCLRFHVTTVGLGTYYPWLRGHTSIVLIPVYVKTLQPNGIIKTMKWVFLFASYILCYFRKSILTALLLCRFPAQIFFFPKTMPVELYEFRGSV